MKRLFCLVPLIMIVISTLWAQQAPYQIPVIIPPSPSAQAFMRYGEIPVDYSTGVPNIEIPIYIVGTKQLELPISISYHASGIKVNDLASEIGLGWVLNAGGIITRTIFGVRDETFNGTRYVNSASQLLDSLNAIDDYYEESSNCYPKIRAFEEYMMSNFKAEDPIRDRFYYKLPMGSSGVFKYSLLSDSIIMLPYRPLKIQKTIIDDGVKPKISELKITDEIGTIHTYVLYFSDHSSSEWYLKQMVSADGTDTISIEYEIPTQAYSFPRSSYTYNESIEPQSINTPCDMGLDYASSIVHSGGGSQANPPLIKRITSSNVILDFTYKERLDDLGGYLKLKRLSNISITQKANLVVIKNFIFNHDYFGNATDQNRRLSLESFTVSEPSLTHTEKYSFKYNKSKVLPPYSYYATNYSEDYWGYYNGSSSPNLIPADFVIHKNKCGNRNPDETGIFAKACMLEEIKYPTGGRTVFQFERNYASNVYAFKYPANTDGYIGGFRVACIINYNESNDTIGVKSYEYEGPCINPIYKEHFHQTNQYGVYLWCDIGSTAGPLFHGVYSYSRDHVYSDPISSIDVSPGLPITYTKVTEYNGTITNHAGKTVFVYNQPYSPSPTFYTIDQYEHPEEFEAPWHYHPYHYDRGNYVPEMTSKATYSFDGTSYHIVSQTAFQYHKYFNKEFYTGINVTRPKSYSTYNWLDVIPHFCIAASEIPDYISSITAIDMKSYQEASLLTESQEITYNPLDESEFVTEKTNYSYNEMNLSINEKTTLSSNNVLLKTSLKYPFDFCNSNNAYCKMVNLNMISPVIEQIDISNNNTVTSTKSNYSFWKSDQYTQNLVGSLIIEKDVSNSASSTFYLGNSLSVKINLYLEMCTGSFNVNISGPSSFNKNYAICSNGNGSGDCTNFCSQNLEETINGLKPGNYTITFTHYPAPGYDNVGFYGTASLSALREKSDLSISATPTNKIYISSVESKTGSNPYETRLNYHNYDKYGNNLSVSKTNDMKETYIWSYNGHYPVIKAANVDFTSLNNAVNSIQIDIQSFLVNTVRDLTTTAQRTAWKNFNTALRNHTSLSKAQVYTYTYKPLVGMTSETDPNGVTTYYEYDGFGRLKYVKDDDGNILKSHEYHYKE